MYTIVCRDKEQFFKAYHELVPTQKNEFDRLIMMLRQSGEVPGSSVCRLTDYSIWTPGSMVSCHGFRLVFSTDPQQFQVQIMSLFVEQLSCVEVLSRSLGQPSIFAEIFSDSKKNFCAREMPFLQWERPDDLIQGLLLIGIGYETAKTLGQTELLSKYRYPARQAQFLSATLEALNLITRQKQRRGYRYVLIGAGKKIAASHDLTFQKQLLHECLKFHPHVKFWMQNIRSGLAFDSNLIHEKYEKDFPSIFSGVTGKRRAESLYYIIKWIAARELIPLVSTRDLENRSTIQLHLDLASAIKEG
jgi:hypothetical protein